MNIEGAVKRTDVVDIREDLAGDGLLESRANQSVARYLVALVGLLVLSLAITVGLLFWSAKTQDEIAIEGSRHLASTAIELKSANLKKILTDYTWWNEAYQQMAVTFDPQWFDENFGDGDYLRDSFGITATFAIGPDNRVLRHMHDSVIAENAEALDIGTHIEGDFGKLIEDARHAVDNEFQAAGGIVSMADQLYFAAVRVIHPHSEDLLAKAAISPTNAYVAVMMIPIDADMLQTVANDFGLADLKFVDVHSPASGLLAIPLQSIGGQRFGYLEWHLDLPSRHTYSVTLPGLAAVIMSIALLGFYILRVLRKNQGVVFQAMLKAKAADLAKVQFLSNVSHELRTPLNGVIGMAQLLGHEELKDGQKKLLDTLLNSAHHQLTLVNDLVDLTRIESDQLELHCRPFDLCSVISDAVALVEEKAKSKGLNVEISLPENAPSPLIGDPIRVRQICLNLLDNAVKFTDGGSIAVALSTQTAGEFERVKLTVRDTGIGINDEDQKHIFTRFMQVDPSMTRNAEGLGLGLPICQALAGAMGGQISLESSPGEGSTFVVSLNLQREGTHKNVLRFGS